MTTKSGTSPKYNFCMQTKNMHIADLNTVYSEYSPFYLFISLSLCDLFENKSDLFTNESHRKLSKKLSCYAHARWSIAVFR